VYLSLSGSNVRYTVSIDGEEKSYVSPATQSKSNCTIGWSRTDLASGRHNLEIKVSDVGDLRRGGPVDWAFDIAQLMSVFSVISKFVRVVDIHLSVLESRLSRQGC
jgi:hypothetical protein